MKSGFTNGKLNKIRRFLTPVLIIALVICGLWLPEVKVKAWQPGDPNAPATLRIRINADGGTTGLYENNEIVVTSTNGNSEFYDFTIPISSCGNIPAKNGVLASDYQVVNYSSFYWNYTDGVPINDTFDLSFPGEAAISLTNVSSHIFGSEGEATIEFKAIYPADASPSQIHYSLYSGGPRTNGNLLWASIDEQYNYSYYYDVTVPALSNLVNPYTDGRNLTGILRYYGNSTVYDQNVSTRELHAGNSYQLKLAPADSSYMTFYPEFDSAIIPVTFDAGDKGTIGDSNSSTLTQNLTFTLGDGGNYYSVDITTLPAINDLPNDNYSANGKWTKDSSFSSFAFVRELNGPYDAIINGDISTGFNLFLFADDVIQDEETYNLKFNALYDETLTLTVNFAVPQNFGGTFPDGSKYLSPLTLTIPEPDTLPDYYAFTIPGEDIDEVSIVYEETGSSDGPYPHYLKAFVDNNNVLEDGTANVALGENATILVDSTIFNDNSASITLTGVFSEQAGLNLFRQGSGDRDFAKLIRFEDNYAVCKGQLDPSTIGSGDALPAGLISFAECFTYAGSEQLLIEDSNGNAVTKMGYGTDYYFYILKSVVDASSNSSVDIPLAPVGKMEFDAIFDAGVGGTITGEGTATTKQVTVSTEIMDGNNNWLAESVSVPEVTPKTGYVFKRWVQQQLTEITMPANEKDIDPQYITGSSANFEIGNTYARSSAGSALRSSGLTYTAEYYQCSLIATFNPGDHAQSGIQSSSTTINAKSYDAATGKFTFEVTFPSYTPVSGYVHDGFEVMTNNYAVSLAQGSYYPAGQTVEIEASAGNATQIELTFTAHYDAMPMLTVNFYTGNTPVGSVSQYPMSNTADSNGLYSYSIDVPDITTYHENFGAAFPIYKILAPENSGISFEVYRGSKNLTEYEVTDNETVVVKVSAATTLRWEAIDAIKTTGDYQVYDGGNCLTRGRWTIGVTGGESDGYEYNVTVPVSFYPGNNVDLTVTKLP